jgi:hypothetical protein
MKNKRWALVNRPVMWALLLILLDLVWLLGLYSKAWFSLAVYVPDNDSCWEIYGTCWKIHLSALHLWNSMHLPVRRLIEPILIPVITTSDPSYPGDWAYYLYLALCLLQSMVIGYVLGLLIRSILRWKNMRRCTEKRRDQY